MLQAPKFISNSAGGKGGGADSYNGAAIIADTEFISNTSTDTGGGLYTQSGVTAVNSLFREQYFNSNGGG